MEIGPGGWGGGWGAMGVHTCLHLLWTHMDIWISAHVHTEAGACLLLRMLTGPTDLLTGDSMEHVQEEVCSAGLISLFEAEKTWISSTSLPQRVLSSFGTSSQNRAVLSSVPQLYFLHRFITT